MAQYYFTMKGTLSNQLPDRIQECLVASGRKTNLSSKYLLAPGGDSFSYLKDSSNSWDWLPLLKPEEYTNDFEATLLFRKLKDGSQNYNNTGSGFYYRAPNSSGDPSSYMAFGTGTYNTFLNFCTRDSSGTQTFPAAATVVFQSAPTPSQYIYFKISVKDNTHKAKVWIKDEETEPTEWEATYTSNSDTNLKGTVGLLIHGYDILQEIVSVAIATDGDVIPTKPSTIVSGTLRKPDNTVAAGFKVILTLVKNGTLVSETITDSEGKYLLKTDYKEGTPMVLMAYPTADVSDSWRPPVKFVKPVVAIDE